MTDPADDVDEDLPYAEGAVWSVQFVRTVPGMFNEYLKNLKAEWTPLMDEAKRQGLILDYRILLSPLVNPDDWNVMLIVQVPDLAALDGHRQKMHDLDRRLRNGRIRRSCAGLREQLGAKLVREITL